MNAFLVLITIILGPQGPMAITLKMPWSSVAACEAYIADPTPILSDFGPIQVLGGQASCEAKVERES